MDLWGRLKDLRYKWGLFFRRNLAYFGGYVAHLGLLVAILGFLGNYRGLEKVATLTEGESVELHGYNLRFDKFRIRNDSNATLFEAVMPVHYGQTSIGTIYPAKSKYPTKAELLNEVGLFSRLWHDIYVVLSDFDKTSGKKATFEIHINPTVRFVWIAAFLMVVGGLIAIFDQIRGQKSRDAIRADS